MKEKTLEGILKEFESKVLSVNENSFKSMAEQRRWGTQSIMRATQEIKELIKEKLPKVKECHHINKNGYFKNGKYRNFCLIYNQTLSEVVRIVEEL